VPVGAVVVAFLIHSVFALDYIHVMLGGLWTGIDLFMGLVIGPIMGSMAVRARVEFIQHLVPTMLFLMPTLAATTITAGFYLAAHEGILNFGLPVFQVAGILVILLIVQGIGIFLPNEVRIFFELRKNQPRYPMIARLGLLNARLAGLQAVFQIALIFVMARIANGLYHF
jgi:hypothetical protein